MHLKLTKRRFYTRRIGEIINVAFKAFKFSLISSRFFTFGVIVTSVFIYLIPTLRSYIEGKVIDALGNSISLHTASNKLLVFLGIYILIFILLNLISSLNRYFEYTYAMKIDRSTDLTLASKYSHLDLEYYENPEFNDLLQKVKENAWKIRVFLFAFFYLIGSLITLFTSIAILLNLSLLLIVVLVLTNLPSFLSEIKFGKMSWGIWQAKGSIRRNYSSSLKLLNSENSLQELKVFRTRTYLYSLIKNLYDKFIKERIELEKRRIVFSTLLDFTGIAGFAYAYYYLITLAIGEQITIGSFIFYAATITRLSNTITEVFKRLSRIYEEGLYVTDFFKFLELPKKINSGKKRLILKSPPKIELRNVWFKYPNSKDYVLKNFNLTINPKEHIAIVGANGAGKSTLIKLLQRFYDVDKGEILINEKNIKELNLDSWYKNVATLSQNYVKYHFNAKTNIGLGDKTRLAEITEIVNAAKLSGADSFINNYADKYNQILSKRFKKGIDPSEGQWQKIALARAFFKDAPILILDEPTSAIDPKAEYEIFQKLLDLAKEKTVVIISHRFSTVRNADRIIVLDNGKIVEEGSHSDLIQKGGMYKEAYDLQKKGYEDI